MLKNINLKELTFENIAFWPNSIKALAVLLTFLIILLLGYCFDLRWQLQNLKTVHEREIKLRYQFESQQQQAVNLGVYKTQLKTLKQQLAAMMKQLPNYLELPGLLEDLSKIGIANGLSFKFIKPLPAKQNDFFTELPIEISLTGTYHQLAQFVSEISRLNHIVVLQDFIVSRMQATETSKENISDIEKLEINIAAVIYHPKS